MPNVQADTNMVLNLHARCKAFRCLPAAGGMMDQPMRLMRLFDVIEGRVAKYRRDKVEELERERRKRDAFNNQ